MTWGAVAGAAVGVVGSALSSGGSGGGGGAGSQTQSKEPWAMAQPWIMNNLVQGQNLQSAYTAQPFSALQNQAYANQNNQSAYMRAAVPSLLGQISGQQVGFDRSNPNARPNAFNFNGLMAAAKEGQQAQASQQGGLLGLLASAPSSGNFNANANTPQVQQPQPQQSTFMQQSDVLNGANGTMGASGLMGTGGYGAFKYGMPMPQPGTQEYRDMSAYFANGGADPNNIYGRKATAYQVPAANPLSYLWSSGDGGYVGAPGMGEGPSSGAPGGAASSGPAGTF